MKLLDQKTVLVTGAARGLGAAIAARCVAHGARVLLADIAIEDLREVASALGTSASAHELEVSNPLSWARLADEMDEDFGRPDVLVNNAGVLRAASLLDTTLEDLEHVLRVNVGGTLLGMQTYLRAHLRMSTRRPGSIINLSSVRGMVGGALFSAYSASKFGIRGLTKVAAVELGPLGIRVNTVCPGPIETAMSAQAPEHAGLDWGGFTSKLPQGRFGHPDEVAEVVAWLGSEASSFVTGIDMPVDGGLTATSYGVTTAPTYTDVPPFEIR